MHDHLGCLDLFTLTLLWEYILCQIKWQYKYIKRTIEVFGRKTQRLIKINPVKHIDAIILTNVNEQTFYIITLA
jgi:hypothetical protein